MRSWAGLSPSKVAGFVGLALVAIAVSGASSFSFYDRGPSVGPNAWNMTSPDGIIDLSNDILGVIQQYVHDCR